MVLRRRRLQAKLRDILPSGIKPFAESFDTLGTITRNALDACYLRCALLDTSFQQISSTSAPHIGLCRTPWWNDADSDSRGAVEEAARKLASARATVSDAALPQTFFALPDVHRLIMAYEAARSYSHEYDAHFSRLSPQLVELIEHGLRIDRNDYEASCREAGRARGEFAAWLRAFDLLLTPSAKGEAPRGLALTGDPLFSRLWTLLRVPSVTLPGLSGERNLPIGVQLVGARGEDERLLGWCEWAEAILGGEPRE